jgi:hypothetical protein
VPAAAAAVQVVMAVQALRLDRLHRVARRHSRRPTCAGYLRAAQRRLARHKRGFAAGWRAVWPLSRCFSAVVRGWEKITRCARCLPASVAPCRPPALRVPPWPVARPIESHHAACSLKITISHPARPSSQVPIRRSFGRLGTGGGPQKGGSLGRLCCCDAGDAARPAARDCVVLGPRDVSSRVYLLCERDARRAGFSLCVGTLWPRARAKNRGIAAVCWGGVLGGVSQRERGVCVLWPSGVC